MTVLLAFKVQILGTMAAVLLYGITFEGGSAYLDGKLLMSLLKPIM